MNFIETWKSNIKAYFQVLPGIRKENLYNILCLATFSPLVAAIANPAEFGTTTSAILTIITSLGGGLFKSLLENWLKSEYKNQQQLLNLIQDNIDANQQFREEADEILGNIQTINLVQSILSEEDKVWFRQTLDELLPKHQVLQNIYLYGNVYLKSIQVIGDISLSSKNDFSPLVETYFRALKTRCQQLPFGILDEQFMDTRDGNVITLRDVYTDLDVVNVLRQNNENEQSFALRLSIADAADRVPLLESITDEKSPNIVLIGEPGSGKTTFINYLTYHILNNSDNLPSILKNKPVIRITLRDTTKYLMPNENSGNANILWSTIQDDFISVLGNENGKNAFTDWMNNISNFQCLVLLDGLDDIPDSNERRKDLIAAIGDMVNSLKSGSRFIVTARPYAYAKKEWTLNKFQSLALAPFNRNQIESFVCSWYDAIKGKGNDWTDSFILSRRKDLLTALFDQNRPYLGDLATRPLLLTLMTILHGSNGELPEDRAELYENAVDLLIKRWQRHWINNKENLEENEITKSQRKLSLMGDKILRKGLETIAFKAHEKQQKTNRLENNNSICAEISKGELLEIFSNLYRDINPLVIIEFIEKRAGLLIARKDGVFIFPHRSFQEFLCACYILNYSKDYTRELINLLELDQDWWREVFLLSVGRLKIRMQSSAIALINAFLPESIGDRKKQKCLQEIDWRKASLAGEALLELRLLGNPDFNQEYNYLIFRIREWLTKLIETGKLDPKRRLFVGDILGKIGDIRRGVNCLSKYDKRLPDIDWVYVPSQDFWISRYPITNGQFKPFIESNGYENKDWWSDLGWQWRNCREGDQSERLSFDTLSQNRDYSLRNQPYWWDSFPWNGENRPVIGVCWFEVEAYINWLQCFSNEYSLFSNLGQFPKYVDLPSNDEWENAIFGVAKMKYPWGNQWKNDACNTTEIGFTTTSVVGMFPKGISKDHKLVDCVGNVWEWTRTVWIQNTENYNSETNINHPIMRIVKGGSWGFDKTYCQNNIVGKVEQYYHMLNVGFRIILSPFERKDS